ncbi:MAG: response regulator [Candidatus Nealsonbacteria bacterium]|nr:response regulator [Candidatus Nealsonbacteria bacterium]
MAKKILIIEDDKFLRELLVKKLLEEGFEVAEAVNGEEGLKKTKEIKPDLILLDLVLPEMSGFDVLAGIKSDPALASTSVIILSNLGQKEDLEKGMKMGAVDYLIKAHHTPREIVDKVKNVVL